MLEPLPASRLCAADTVYDSDASRNFLKTRGTEPVIPNNPTRRQIKPFDQLAYRRGNIIERTFCRLKDWRRVATRCDELMLDLAATCYIAAIVTQLSLEPRITQIMSRSSLKKAAIFFSSRL